MLTNLDFLKPGQKFPPDSEKDRLAKYEYNKLIFDNRHDVTYEKSFERIQRVIGNFQQVVSYEVLANYQKLISLKVADLLLGEPPQIKCGEDGSLEDLSIKTIAENSDLHNNAYMVAIDLSRYGDGLFYVYKNEEGKGVIDITQPSIWFPVVSPDNVKKIVNHVLAWTYTVGDYTYLKVQVHYKGRYDETVYLLEKGIGSTIKEITVPTKTISTGLSDFAIVQVSNVSTSDTIFGYDDYGDIDSIISEIEVRVSQIAKILDKHAEPSIQGPSSALQQNSETGEWYLKAGKFFARDSKEDAEVSYITWDAQLEANFRIIEKLVNILYTISEMGAALLGDTGDKMGSIPSGSALRRLMISPLAKVNRVRMRFDPALKKAIKLCSQLKGQNVVDLSNEDISITWHDGLPSDPMEEAQIMDLRTAHKATISQFTAIQKMDGLSASDAEDEMQRINDEEAMTNPIGGINNQFANNNQGE